VVSSVPRFGFFVVSGPLFQLDRWNDRLHDGCEIGDRSSVAVRDIERSPVIGWFVDAQSSHHPLDKIADVSEIESAFTATLKQ